MTVALASRTAPGDVLLVEDLTYPGVKALAGLLHLRVVAVPSDARGPDPEALEAAARRFEARAFYLMPTIHNPTARVLDDERRDELVAVARARGIELFEDDTYAFAAENAPRPLAARAPELVWHFVGTSKSIAAGLRIGYLTAPDQGPGLLERLAAVVAATAWMTPPAIAELAARWIADGTAERTIAWRRREARARQELLRTTLAGTCVGAASDPHAAAAPHAWLTLPEPWRAAEFCRAAHSAGVGVTPAEVFVAGRGGAPQAIRIALGTPRTREDVARGLAILARVLERAPLPSPVV